MSGERQEKAAEAPQVIFARHSSLLTVFALSWRPGAFARGLFLFHQATFRGRAWLI